ncbi:LysR family transcriptional regulator [Tropicibacter oceani]|uniref:LysR family transcriptional regulator n=1 Tax=Tropicibacter oceani TaxID=3058420 RepID=A0ABY8QMT6_9RHOB|nr:LysR family transcriptional regulator [Tropicibacter oceani]WGW05944.1 LysR family transcriptional regulator [Tropicibacter oceani]
MPLRFTLRQLEYFVAVGEMGSIALAAEKVNVSSPSISAAISQLEKEFGIPLFVRQHAQGLSLTQAGRQMLDQVRVVLREANIVLDLAGDISGEVRGALHIGCLVTFAQLVLPSLRRRFQAGFPEVRVRQSELNQAEIFSALRRAEIDVALTYDLQLPADLIFESLLELPPYVIVDVAHPLVGADEVTVADLADFPMVLLDLPYSSEYFLSFFAAAGITPNVAERTRDMAVMRSLVANGFGFSIANVPLTSNQSPDGKPLCYIPMRGAVRPMRMGLLMPTDAEQSSVIRAFVGHCKSDDQARAFPGFGPMQGPTARS